MPNTREKLMMLIWHKQDCGLTHNANGQDFVTYNAELADHLIANDVVPVVRCKDCKEIASCRIREVGFFTEDGYCQYGERREGE